MKQNLIIGALIALSVALGTWWFFENFEQTDETHTTPPRGLARSNPHLAAERFLTQMGATATNAKSLADLDQLPPKGVLILVRNREALGTEQAERILSWVDAGGLLITEPEFDEGSDHIVSALEIEQEIAARKVLTTTTVTLPWTGDREYTVNLRGRTTLARGDPDDETLFKLDDERGTRVLGFARGEGKVVAFSRLSLIENGQIGRESHADLLWQILRWHGAPTTVVFFNHPVRLSIWDWFVSNAPYVIAAGAVFLLLWLWRIAIRFGPIAPDPLPIRRRLTDHLAASGRFLWHERAADDSLIAARELALRRMERIAPGFTAAAAPAQAKQLQNVLGLSIEEARAVVAGGAANANDFIALTRSLQRVHAATRASVRSNV
ncbi:MAG: DUF4350 domain-containing protein [Burkholderiales bacterium]